MMDPGEEISSATGEGRLTRRARIESYPDGPLIVRGDVEIVDESGCVLPRSRRTLALCRCGVSLIKPLCDGTHKLMGFRSDPHR